MNERIDPCKGFITRPWAAVTRRRTLVASIVLSILCGWTGVKASGHEVDKLTGKVLLNGRSTLRNWSCESIEGSLQLPFEIDPATTHAFFREIIDRLPQDKERVFAQLSTLHEEGIQLTVVAPIQSLDCGNRRLEQDLSEAVDASQYPLVEVEIGRIVGIDHRNNPGSPVLILRVEGEIKLAGTSHPVELDVSVDFTEQEELRFRAGKELLMTDFDVTPPTALLGLVRANNRFRVDYELTLPEPQHYSQGK